MCRSSDTVGRFVQKLNQLLARSGVQNQPESQKIWWNANSTAPHIGITHKFDDIGGMLALNGAHGTVFKLVQNGAAILIQPYVVITSVGSFPDIAGNVGNGIVVFTIRTTGAQVQIGLAAQGGLLAVLRNPALGRVIYVVQIPQR